MRDHRRMDRFVVLPFSIGCASQSSVAVADTHPKKSQAAAPTPPLPSGGGGGEDHHDQRQRSSFGLLSFPKPSISSGFQKLIRGIKSLSQLFVVYYEEEEEEERDMEIGLPTDVQHVAHIGWDGFNTTTTTTTTTTTNMSNNNNNNNNSSSSRMKSWSSLSMKQFEVAMASQASGVGVGGHGPLSFGLNLPTH